MVERPWKISSLPVLMIRSVLPSDTDDALALCEASSLFQPDELAEVREMLGAALDGSLGPDHHWLVDDDDGLASVAYLAPETFAEGVWNLHLIAVDPACQGEGRGTAMLRHVEDGLAERGERLLLIETSGLGSFEQTRAFYRKNGYDEEARIRDFYEAGDDKVVFRKALQGTGGAARPLGGSRRSRVRGFTPPAFTHFRRVACGDTLHG